MRPTSDQLKAAEEKREDAGKCKSCGGPSTYDPKRYQGGTFCENKGCPAYQEIPAAEEGGEWEEEYDKLERKGYFEDTVGMFEDRRQMVSHDSIKSFIRTLLSRTRKEATEEAWRKAVGAVPEKPTAYAELKSFTMQGRNIGNNSARQQLINAAKGDGVEIGV